MNKLFKVVMLFVAALAVGIGSFMLSSEDETQPPLSTEEEKRLTQFMKDYSDYYAQVIKNNTVSGVSESVQPGDGGLNTALIALMNEGYCKDYLSIALEGAEGTLTEGVNSKVPIEAAIAVPIAETSGFYKIGDGKTVVMSDIPTSLVENYTSGTVYTWGTKDHNSKGGVSPFGGPFQYTSGPGKLTTLQKKSKYSPSSSSNGDPYNVPDCIASVGQFLTTVDGVRQYVETNYDSLDTMAIIAVMMNGHNRGAGGPGMIAYGKEYHGSGSDFSTLKDGKTAEYILGAFTEICNDMLEDLNKADTLGAFNLITMNTQNKAMFWPMLFHHGWYIDQTAYNKAVSSNYIENSWKLWNLVYPSEAFNTVTEYQAYVKSNFVKRACDVLTEGDAGKCDRLFGTRNGDYYSYTSIAMTGNIYKPKENVNDLYTESNKYTAYCMDEIAAQHILHVVFGARVVFAKMLAYAGVGIDPTDASTYCNTMVQTSSLNTWVADAPSWLATYGIKDISSFGAARIALLNAAYTVAFKDDGSKRVRYSMSYRRSYSDSVQLDDLTYLDCSSFVDWVYGYTERKYNYKTHPSGFPQSTSAYAASRNYLKPIDPSDVKPGDILITLGYGSRAGHAAIYLAPAGGGKIYVMECNSATTLDGTGIRAVTCTLRKPSENWTRGSINNYRIFRFYQNGVTPLDEMTK